MEKTVLVTAQTMYNPGQQVVGVIVEHHKKPFTTPDGEFSGVTVMTAFSQKFICRKNTIRPAEEKLGKSLTQSMALAMACLIPT
ncbi:MAG TPA: hypothetical protein VJB37_01690 [Patescibacteria group bacterium]|nr:hypothetical protein [Patescibacteria group bacterium]